MSNPGGDEWQTAVTTNTPITPNSDDDSSRELRQRPLPKISILCLIGLITVSAFLFTTFKLAGDGHRWAQVVALLIGMFIGTLIAYACTFLLGMFFDSTIGRVRRAARAKKQNRRSSAVVALAVAITLSGLGEAQADRITWVGGSYPGFRIISDYSLNAGVAQSPGPGGYRTLHLRFRPTRKTFARDHRVTVSVSGHGRVRPRIAATTTKSFLLPEGGGTTNFKMLLPLFGRAESFRLHVIEDGRRAGDDPLVLVLANDMKAHYAGQKLTVGIFDPAPLKLDIAFPDVRSMVTILGSNPMNRAPLPEDEDKLRLNHQDALELAGEVQPAWIQFRPLETAVMHDNWLAYSDLDIILMHHGIWYEILGRPQAATAIRQWTAAGGNLWIYGEGASDRRLADAVAADLKLEDLSKKVISNAKTVNARLRLSETNDTSPLMDQYWNSMVIKQSTTYGVNMNFKDRKDVFGNLKSAGNPMVDVVAADALSGQVSSSGYGLGKIVMIDRADPFPGSFQLWMALDDACFGNSAASSWSDRMGINYGAGNTNYWRWLIASVGGPPVKSFLTLNTLFVLIVGPIAYFLLRRMGRLYLLYFAAPALAVLVSSGLFAFAMLSDGIGTKLRPQQWTWVDPAHDVVVYQDRSTLYSAFGRGELQFTEDTMVTAMLPMPSSEYGTYNGDRVSPGGRIHWTGDQQIWSGDFLPTRSQVQYLATTPLIDAEAPLSFRTTGGTESSVMATNRSRVSVGPLMYRDADGAYWKLQQLPPGKTLPMVSSNGQALAEVINNDVLPEVEFVPSFNTGWNAYYNPNSPTDQVPWMENLAMQWRRGLPTNAFICIADIDAERFPMKGVQAGKGVQVMMGYSP